MRDLVEAGRSDPDAEERLRLVVPDDEVHDPCVRGFVEHARKLQCMPLVLDEVGVPDQALADGDGLDVLLAQRRPEARSHHPELGPGLVSEGEDFLLRQRPVGHQALIGLVVLPGSEQLRGLRAHGLGLVGGFQVRG